MESALNFQQKISFDGSFFLRTAHISRLFNHCTIAPNR